MARRTVMVIGLWCLASVLVVGCDSGSPSAPAATTTVTVAPPASTGADTSQTSTGTSTSRSPQAKVFDNAAVQTGVAKILAEDYQVDAVGDVTCPSRQQVVDGAKFQCGVMVGEQQKKVTITVKGTDGDYEVSAPE